MQKMQIPWSQIASALTARLRGSDFSLPALAEQSGVNYHAIRRMRRDGVKNRVENAERLCTFFGISQETTSSVTEKDLTAAIVENWDGSAAQGHLLMELVRCVASFRIAAWDDDLSCKKGSGR